MDAATSYTYYASGVKPSRPEDSGNKYAYAKYSAYQAEREARERAEALLDRFVELYGETPVSGKAISAVMTLWRDYREWAGDHMILTEEGWEPGESKASYVGLATSEKRPISDFILDEVNVPKRKGRA